MKNDTDKSMPVRDLRRIKSIAKRIRAKVERQNAKTRLFGNDLCGCCGIAAYELFKALRKSGYKPWVAMGLGHSYVELNEYVVDVTATQFGREKVMLQHRNDFGNDYGFWNTEGKARTLRGIRRLFAEWEDQSPFETVFWK